MTSFHLITSLKTVSPNTVMFEMLGLGSQHKEIGGDAVQPITPTKSVFTFEKDPQHTLKLEKYCPGPAPWDKHQGLSGGGGRERGKKPE